MDEKILFILRKMEEIASTSVINHSILAIAKYDAVAFVDVESGQITFQYLIDEKVRDEGICGISCVSAHENELIYAIGDICTPARIILFTYPKTCLGQLQSETSSFNFHIRICE